MKEYDEDEMSIMTELERKLGRFIETRKYINLCKSGYDVVLEDGKEYNWCRCGKSYESPFCDGYSRIF